MLFIFLAILTILVVYQWRGVRRNPRGPTPLPLIGNFHQMIYYGWRTGGVVAMMNELRRQYGNVFTLWFGPFPAAFISDYQLAQETHVKQNALFSNRLSMGGLNWIREGRGILMSNGEFWQDHRRFALQTLRNFGLGRNIMEERIMEEFRYRLDDFKKTNWRNGGIEVHANSFFDLLIGSVINQLLVSERFEQDDKEFETLKVSIASTFEKFSFIDLFIPVWLFKKRFMKWRADMVLSALDYVYEFSQRRITEKVSKMGNCNIDELEDGGNDFVEAFLIKMHQDKKNGLETSFNLETLAVDLLDLWVAGQETTSTTLSWTFAILLHHPEVVRKVYEEVKEVTGGTRLISLSDRRRTPYLNATADEVQRYASILNMNILRVMGEDATIDGQPIASGTVFTTQMSMIHTDEQLFESPEEFKPERFLENNNLEKVLIPFGIGKRSCPGESLARAEIYLILGNLLLNYKLEAVGEAPPLKTPSPFGVMKRSPSYNIRFVPRSE